MYNETPIILCVKDENTGLAQSLRKSLEGAREASKALPENLRGKVVGSAVSDIKLKSTELSGLTGETIKEAVKKPRTKSIISGLMYWTTAA